jgi:hypothetical protein
MWVVAKNSIALLFQGRLFADPMKVSRQWALGNIVTATILFVGAKVGAPIWFAGLTAGLIGGALQPYLFKDLRYH